jgi:uncharacterized protein YjbJ (UPF0337 family)
MKGKLDAMNDKTKGQYNQAKGAIKTKVGNLTDNNKLKAEGLVDTIVGKTQETTGNIKESINKAPTNSPNKAMTLDGCYE